ncbi:uncharacterized protein lekr1 isoform X2 [Brachyhypopomus gauderio]
MEEEQLRNSVDQELKLPTPSYPLPMEIQQMERAETACSYCGVSYFILHEFQRLQKRLREVEEEVAAGRGALERQRAAAERQRAALAQLQEVRAAQQLSLDRAKALELQVSEAERELGRARADLQRERHRCLRLGSLCSQQRVLLRESQSVLQHCGAELCGVREHISLFHQHWDTSTAQILYYCCSTSTERDELQQEVGSKGAELAKLQGEVQQLGAGMDTWRLRAQTLESQVQNQELLQNQNQQAHLHVQALKQEVESLREELQKSGREREHIEDLLEAERRGAEEAHARQQHQCEEQSATILRLSLHLREKEESWSSCQHQCDALQQQLLAWQRKGEEMTHGLERAKGEREELQATLALSRTQITTLLQEREALRSTQRDDLQELESAFRKRLEVVEEQRSKLEETERQTALGLHMERQRNLELINTQQTEQQQLQEEFRSSVMALQGEVSALALRLHEQDQERRSRDEEHQQRALDLQQALSDLQQLREECAALQEENVLLQETVRRECEERADLTAALSTAQAQLKKLRTASTGPPETRSPQGPARPSLPGLGPGHGRPPGRDTAAGAWSAASWHGASCPAPTLPRLHKQRDKSVREARHHVAMAMSRTDMR